MPIDFERIAELFMFSKDKPMSDIVAEQKLEFRKGKDTSDIKRAFEKALKRGNAKTEFELDWFALYLKGVFKANQTK